MGMELCYILNRLIVLKYWFVCIWLFDSEMYFENCYNGEKKYVKVIKVLNLLVVC